MNDVFVDADIILDLLLKRKPFFAAAERVLSLAEQKVINVFTTPVVLANIYYIATRLTGRKNSLENLRKLIAIIKVATVDEKTILLAINSKFGDFEDAIQYYSAKSLGASFLLTRNKADYKVTDIKVCTAEEYLKMQMPLAT